MRQIRTALVGAILAVALSPAVVSAGPPESFVLTIDCSDGNSYDINFGAPKNQGTALFVVGESSILTSNYFRLTIDGHVVIDSVRGLQGLGSQDLLTCVGDALIGDQTWTYTIQGWITPRD